jgi:glycosyltransferase involved in cell wall biosynthesis
VVLVANGCTDDTVTVARSVAASARLHLDIIEPTLPAGAGVGTARRIGCAYALDTWASITALLTTDADCRVAPDWVVSSLARLDCFAAVCGMVTPAADEIAVLANIDPRPAEMEAAYERLVTTIYRHFCPGPCGLAGDHWGAAGASLAVRPAAYRAIGGFAEMATGEDRDLVRRLKQAGFGVWHAGDVQVSASCRLDGRASGGMAQALRARVEHRDYLIDDSLPSASRLLADAFAGRLGPWPLQVGPKNRLKARELGPEIARLEQALRMLLTTTPAMTAAPLVQSDNPQSTGRYPVKMNPRRSEIPCPAPR